MISVEPPPISKISAPWYLRADQGRAAQGGKIGLLFGEITVERDARLVAGAGDQRCRHCRPGAPPGWRWRGHGGRRCWAMRSAQIFSAAMVRSMAASDRRPVLATPSPSRTMREKESTTRKSSRRRGPGDQKPAIVGAEIEHRQKRSVAGACPARLARPGPRMCPVFLQFHPTAGN